MMPDISKSIEINQNVEPFCSTTQAEHKKTHAILISHTERQFLISGYPFVDSAEVVNINI